MDSLFSKVMARVFKEWDRRYRENPEAYWSTVEHLCNNTPQTYGEAAALYFENLLLELGISFIDLEREKDEPNNNN